jgi:hypothetical protein
MNFNKSLFNPKELFEILAASNKSNFQKQSGREKKNVDTFLNAVKI